MHYFKRPSFFKQKFGGQSQTFSQWQCKARYDLVMALSYEQNLKSLAGLTPGEKLLLKLWLWLQQFCCNYATSCMAVKIEKNSIDCNRPSLSAGHCSLNEPLPRTDRNLLQIAFLLTKNAILSGFFLNTIYRWISAARHHQPDRNRIRDRFRIAWDRFLWCTTVMQMLLLEPILRIWARIFR